MKNNSQSNTAVVIIVHKKHISIFENKSLAQCLKILKNNDIFLVYPESLDLSEYSEYTNSLIKLPIDNSWLMSYQNFNRLKINYFFYEKFKKYKFILFYELDSWVFTNQLSFWENSGFDYIGAPWYSLSSTLELNNLGVGNGGFSLRKVSKHLKLLKSLRRYDVLKKFEKYNDFGIIPRLYKIIFLLKVASERQSFLEINFYGQEDIFWTCELVNGLNHFNSNSIILNFLYKIYVYKKFHVADYVSAIKFSFEMFPKELYRLNDNNLPFGCHAWQKYDPQFWDLYIPSN